MPVYLCKPGLYSSEPWRQGIPVYSEPCATGSNEGAAAASAAAARGGDRDETDREQRQSRQDSPPSSRRRLNNRESSREYPNSEDSSVTGGAAGRSGDADPPSPPPTDESRVIRRIRHSEVVLVEDVVACFGNYWLKLRWPGTATGGGFAGYICLVASTNIIKHTSTTTTTATTTTLQSDNDSSPTTITTMLASRNHDEVNESMDDAVNPAINGSNENADEPPTQRPPETLHTSASRNSSPAEMRHGADSRAPSPGFYEANSDDQTMRCLRTGIIFPSSPTLQLLSSYEDGLVPPVALPVEGQQPVFCRICRDGLHDDDDQQQRMEGENPFLSPCECSGSMAFVHYLCIEQWRCRSRHPEARNGTHCETCSKPYALPPPTSRPVSQVEEEWLEAMPPHVMAALRQPHFGWQVGAALVRRRWLRPMAPIILSPMVALYCRARRLLKKRGVSRRRWACSLCRRRARWKCVRCLRSYYCSRQCQNVSWHIVHKHVCYKPSRFWWSVVVYTSLLLFMIPDIFKDPLLYDLAFSFIPPSFYIMAVLGGGLATFLKKTAAIDLRGRALEFIVVALTAFLVYVSWGLTWGFFGSPESCVGVLHLHEDNAWIDLVRRFLLQPARTYFIFWDQMVGHYAGDRFWICTSRDHGHCFPYVSLASPDDLLSSAACAGDLQCVTGLWIAAGLTLAASAVLKKRRRGNRPHQD